MRHDPAVNKLSDDEVSQFLASKPDWKRDGDVLSRAFAFKRYADSVSFAVAVALVAEKRDHHPDILLSWGKVEVRWSTHDAGGITALDTEMAGASDSFYKP